MTAVFEREENAYTLGVQAGLWGYPLVHRVLAFPRALAVKGIGLNSFQRFPRLKTAADRFVVTPNNLTIDSYAIVDLRRGPVVLFVPPLAEARWFIVQIGDAFDDVILNLGGNRPAVAGAYLLVGPEFEGRRPGELASGAGGPVQPHIPLLRSAGVGAESRLHAAVGGQAGGSVTDCG